ncbi:hypothetical protein [Actinomadura violacea]|uniref:Lipoprotein n=1 Tax=Actinomadura violacea TaxID=2819934 RepID=A0ABS3SAT7_9ACTN|nr:hypothetical protein [Actinomadura violacea]MBO2465981.1 hypothetical protein [Actinomadura violacea]
MLRMLPLVVTSVLFALTACGGAEHPKSPSAASAKPTASSSKDGIVLIRDADGSTTTYREVVENIKQGSIEEAGEPAEWHSFCERVISTGRLEGAQFPAGEDLAIEACKKGLEARRQQENNAIQPADTPKEQKFVLVDTTTGATTTYTQLVQKIAKGQRVTDDEIPDAGGDCRSLLTHLITYADVDFPNGDELFIEACEAGEKMK